MNQRSAVRRLSLVAFAGVACLACAASPKPRATPPGAKWPRSVADTFFPDAFTTLQGQRPDFGASRVSGGSLAPGAGGGGGAAASGSGFKWSTLVSEETLTDEIKEMKNVVGQAIASPSTFKGGGYNKARVGFSTVALSFGVIAAYDADIRWKKQAEQARDLFGRVAANCKVGTEQSLAESKLRMADLEALLPVRDFKARHASTLLTFDAVVDAVGQAEAKQKEAASG